MVDQSDSCDGPMMIRQRGWWAKTADGWFLSNQFLGRPEELAVLPYVHLYHADGSDFHVLPSEVLASELLWTYGVYGGVPFELVSFGTPDRQPVRHPVALSASDVWVSLIVYNELEWLEPASKIPGVEVRHMRGPDTSIVAVSLSVPPCELEEYRVRLRWTTGETT